MINYSTIAILLEDNTVQQIHYCYDDYLTDIANILQEKYNTLEKAKQLMLLGNIPYIQTKPISLQENNLDTIQAKHFKDLSDYNQHRLDEKYNYLFKDNKWYYNIKKVMAHDVIIPL